MPLRVVDDPQRTDPVGGSVDIGHPTLDEQFDGYIEHELVVVHEQDPQRSRKQGVCVERAHKAAASGKSCRST